MNALDDDAGDPGAQDPAAASVEERAANGEHLEDQPPLFETGVLDGGGVTPQTLIRKGLPVELTCSLSRAEVPLRGSLPNPSRFGRALVTYLPAPAHETPIREDRNDPAKVTSWKVRQDLRVTFVQDANDVAELVSTEFETLLATEPEAAGALLERLSALATEALGAPA